MLLLVFIGLKDAFLLPLVPDSIMYSTKGNCGRILSYTEIQILPIVICTIFQFVVQEKSHISIPEHFVCTLLDTSDPLCLIGHLLIVDLCLPNFEFSLQ